MMTLTADQAFDAYEAVRHRLPTPVTTDIESRHVETLAEVIDEFDVFLLDAFGVLNIGETAIPGARDRVDALRRAGKRVLVVSNAASVPPENLHTKYRNLGFDFDTGDVVTSRATLAANLNGKSHLNWGVMAGADSDIADLGAPNTTLLDDDPAAFEDAEGFLLVGSATWTDRRQALLEASLAARPRPVLVANPDIVAPREHGFSTEPGHFAHRLADQTGVAPEFFGKPFANIFELAFARLGPVNKARVLMVGDSLHTDILGAQTVGISSALISGYGFLAGHDIRQAILRAGIIPSLIVERP